KFYVMNKAYFGNKNFLMGISIIYRRDFFMIYHRYNLIIRVAMVIIIFLLISMILIMNNVGIADVFLNTKELPIYSVERSDKKISISFDAAWGDEFTDDI